VSLSVPDLNFRVIAPTLIVAITALIVLLAELVTPAHRKRWLGLMSLIGLLIAAGATIGLWDMNASAFNKMVVADNFGLFLTLVILLGAALSILLAMDFIRAHRVDQGEYYALTLFAVVGMILMATATDLIVIFLALELLSLPLYILAAFKREDSRSLEAGLKYFLLGAFSSAFFLYGIAFIFGGTGTTNLMKIADALTKNPRNDLVLLGAGLLLVGFAFKVALVPFHWWTPDVYDGAPTAVTAFMSVAVKAAAFGAFFRAFLVALPALAPDWRIVLAVIAVLTMTLGNVAALLQSNVKRMLAYSAVAHAGFILTGVIAGNQPGLSATLFYLFAYAFSTLGAFAVVSVVRDANGAEETSMARWAGLGRRYPLVGVVFSLFLLAFAGIPLTSGFVSKFAVFKAAGLGGAIPLVIVGVLASAIAAYFYVRVIVLMFFTDPPEDAPEVVTPSALSVATITLTAAITFALGALPQPLLDLANNAARFLP